MDKRIRFRRPDIEELERTDPGPGSAASEHGTASSERASHVFPRQEQDDGEGRANSGPANRRQMTASSEYFVG